MPGKGFERRGEWLTSGDCAVRAGGGGEGWGFRGGRLEVSRRGRLGVREGGVRAGGARARRCWCGLWASSRAWADSAAAAFGLYMGLLEDNTLLS